MWEAYLIEINTSVFLAHPQDIVKILQNKGYEHLYTEVEGKFPILEQE